MKFRTLSTLGFVSVVTLAACGGGGAEAGGGVKAPTSGPKSASGDTISKAAEDSFKTALDAFIAHDKAGDWNDAACTDVASRFQSAAREQKSGKFPEATFNAGLAYQRCGKDKEARAAFQQAITDDPKFHHARVQLALYQFKADGNLDAAIGALQQAVLDAQFQNVPALVNLATFQMQRDGASGSSDCKDDMECAKKNLQRALAIDDGYMPAFNQLALYYFKQAKKRAGAVKTKKGREIATNAALAKRADVQQLELAALVCGQAVRKNPSYAPIHNTAGLIQNELGQVNGAVAEFANAAKLDPRFFEAQMNYAFVNLSFRGFENAEQALRKAIAMQPNDYDAHLGLALALRGQINDANFDAQLAAVNAELETCKKLDPARPDAYYNLGILTQEYKAKSGMDKAKTIAALKEAKAIFADFLGKASGKPEYDGAAKRAKERMQDIDDTIQFLEMPDAPAAPPPSPPAAGATEGAPPAAGQAGAAGPAAPASPVTPPKK
jgi:tetratricopeptide (TPR) repeat protein